MKPEREFTIPEIGVLQWWSDAPWPDVHWYAGEDQRAYRVTIDEHGQPVAIAHEDGQPVRVTLSETPGQQNVLI